ncbi:MAG: hypothetical protein EOM37_07415 [Proteobacteria bacterium]|jgi:hypothetical protein|nr:hypothetical protein [Alphaproteobacteria bacterium]NCC03858.1 hypothetical protein [Pseudomonadota bacterium]
MEKSLQTSVVAFVLLALIFSGVARAEVPKELGTFSYWKTYQLTEGTRQICYMSITASPPIGKVKGKKARRGDVVLMITHRPGEGSTDVVSYTPGAKFKSSKEVVAKIGKNSFSLFTQADMAWARDAATDHALSLALRGGEQVTFHGTLASGDSLAETINLKGSNKAYETISRACDVQIAPLPTSRRESPTKKSTSKSKIKKQ